MKFQGLLRSKFYQGTLLWFYFKCTFLSRYSCLCCIHVLQKRKKIWSIGKFCFEVSNWLIDICDMYFQRLFCMFYLKIWPSFCQVFSSQVSDVISLSSICQTALTRWGKGASGTAKLVIEILLQSRNIKTKAVRRHGPTQNIALKQVRFVWTHTLA